MFFGGIFGLIFFTILFLLFLFWFIVRLILIYFKYFHQIQIRFGSLGFGTIENLDIEHRHYSVRIRSFEISSISSVIAWQCPLIYVDQIDLKIFRRSNESKRKEKKNWRKILQILQFVSIRLEHFHVEYENISFAFQRLCSTSINSNAEISMNWDQIQLLISEKNRRSTILCKILLNSIEIQTNFHQKFLVSATHSSVEIDSIGKFFDLFEQNSTNDRTSNFRYVDRNLVQLDRQTNSNGFFDFVDRIVDVLHEPRVDISIRYFHFQYKNFDRHYSHLFDVAHFSLHNASKLSDDVRRAYTMKIQLDSQSTFLLHNLSLITIYPLSIDISSQFNEFYLQLHEETLEEIRQIIPKRSSNRKKTSWKFDRRLDLSFQFLNPSFVCQLSDIDQWLIFQLSLFKMNFHCDDSTTKTLSNFRSKIELKNFLVRTSIDDEENNGNSFQKVLNDLSRDHLWNCLCYASETSLNIEQNQRRRIEIEAEKFRFQSNEIFISIFKRLQTKFNSIERQDDVNDNSTRPIDEFSLNIKTISIVLCEKFPIYLHLSISSIRVNSNDIELKKLLGFIDRRPTENFSFNTLNRGEKFIDIRRFNVEKPFESTSRVVFPHDITIVWSTKLHLFLFRFYLSLKTDRPTTSSRRTNRKLSFIVEKSAHIFLQLSTDCRLYFSLEQFSIEFLRQVTPFVDLQIFIKTSKLLVDCQQQCFFHVENISFSRLPHSDTLTGERILLKKTLPSLQMLENRASSLQIQTFSIRFPFDSTFNEVIEKTVNIRKWLKRLHRTNADLSQDFLREIPKHSISEDVWTDLSIKIEDFELTIVDDLFEVKLFQNYCLMADEYHERELREQELQRRINEYERFSHPLNDVTLLKKALVEISSTVYIDRCRKTNFDQNQQRIKRNLIRWHLRHVDLVALADRSWTGKENLLNMIHQIDHESPPIVAETTDLCTIWCRYVLLKCDEWSIHFRDFRQPLWQMQQFHLWGHICAAEVTPDRLESIRNPWVEIGEPYSPSRVQVQRLLSPLKFYHDINSDIGSFLISYGPAWENTMAQVNLCLNGITPRASDPSPLLSWWDKIRLYLHGRWSFAAGKMSWLYHVASSPYNDTEEMEWLWDQAYVDWTNGKFIFQAASLSIKLRTSSKYDDCCLLFLPNIDTRISLQWLCHGDPNDHHAVRLNTRDAVRARNSSQPHDSYASYRSHHLKLAAKFECKEVPKGGTPPTCTIYASTLRFCERVKNTMMSITRPTRRGPLFLGPGETAVPPRKPLLSRHYESIELQLILPQFRVKYLTSFARQTGAQVDCQLFNFVTHQTLNLINHNDGLARRARIAWTPKMMNVHLKSAETWLLRDANEDKDPTEHIEGEESQQERTFFLSLDSLIYVRSANTGSKTSTHSILIDELKAVWTLTNRRILFLVYERYRRNNILRSNLSNPFAKELEHLQQEKNLPTPSEQSPSDENSHPRLPLINEESTSNSSSTVSMTVNGVTSQPSTLASFLDQLISESEHKPSVDLDQTVDASVSLVGLRQCTKDDVDEHTLHIELTHSQIALRGPESRGYVILSSKLALVDQYRHQPIWRDEQLCDKTSWHGDLQAMQYYATTDHLSSSSSTSGGSAYDDEIIWIPRQNIRDEDNFLGESSRSVIGSIANNDGHGDRQLQCIVSKSNATLSYVFYTEQTQQEEETEKNIVIPPLTRASNNENHPIGESDRLLVDSFTFIHNDIQLSTNSSQYRTIADIVNNLLLYVEPKEEGANNKLRKLRLQIQLANNLPVLRDNIRHLLERVRSTLAELRRLEREIFYYNRYRQRSSNQSSSSDDEDDVDEPNEGATVRERALSFTTEEYEQLQMSYNAVKAELNKLAEKLGMMCAVYKDMQIARIVKLRIAATTNKVARLERRYELHGGSITWFIKHEDGQITNAQFLLRNILYTKRYYENSTNEHSISIGQAQVDNLLPDDRYRTILISNCQQQQTMIRVYCKEGESVGGIPVKEHLEINVAPLVIQMTRRFSQMLMAFLFPNKTQGNQELQQQQQQQRLTKPPMKHVNPPTTKRRTRSAEGMFRRFSRRVSNDIRWGEEELLTGRSLYYFSNRDLDQMEKRAKHILTFQYIKIPEVSLIVSYKLRGTKEKKIGDLENAHISFPTLEYRDLTCSWHDLVLAIKSDVKTVLLSQAIRQNINLRLPFIGKSTRAQNQQLLATAIPTTMINGETTTTTNHQDSTSNTDLNDEEQKHKMKLVLGSKISKDFITPLKRRKD